MRAVIHERYGPPEVLRITDVEQPLPKDDEVLVRVYASTVTRSDAMSVRSVDWFSRLLTGIRRPRRTTFGSEFAGVVESSSGRVTPPTSAPPWPAAASRRSSRKPERPNRGSPQPPQPAGGSVGLAEPSV